MVFVLANALTTVHNTAIVHNMQVREFPIITTLVDLRQDASILKKTYEDAVAYENEFLILEAEHKAELIAKQISFLDTLLWPSRKNTNDISEALKNYTTQAEQLAKHLINSPRDLDALSNKANNVNIAFKKLMDILGSTLRMQRHQYNRQLVALNENQRRTTITAAAIGFFLLIFLVSFTFFITRKIIAAVKRSDTLKEAFLTTVSHELRTPLSGILGALNLLQSASSAQERNELICMGRKSSRSMNKIVDDILLFAELMQGKTRVIFSEFVPKNSLQEVIELTQALSEEKKITFTYDIPDVTLISDERKLSRTLGNLLSNAVKYTEAGEISLKISLKDSSAGIKRTTRKGHSAILHISVLDTGPGIDPDYLKNIFMPFEQGNSAWDRRYQGIGLGLPMSFLMINSLKGTLNVQNRLDAIGTLVEVSFPCSIIQKNKAIGEIGSDRFDRTETAAKSNTMTEETTAEQAILPAEQASKANPISGTTTSATPTTKVQSDQYHRLKAADPKPLASQLSANTTDNDRANTEATPKTPVNSITALIVEDNRTNQVILQLILKKLDIQTSIANNGAEALDILESSEFDIIFMDCQMPVMDGYTATQHIRKLEGIKGAIPIIAVTANTRDADKARCFEVGMDDFLEKPINLNAIKYTLGKRLQLRVNTAL
jgi:signal transduction histidine kinase/CheY-like chemotaxis protein